MTAEEIDFFDKVKFRDLTGLRIRLALNPSLLNSKDNVHKLGNIIDDGNTTSLGSKAECSTNN